MSHYWIKALEIMDEVNKAILGKEDCVKISVAAMLAGGHILLNDIPGVGKTTLALSLARAMSLHFNRVQFTPDVLPSDLVGFSVYRKETDSFVYQPGSVFCNLFLADEINRTSPKTQSALLEVMEERQVTVDGITRKLPNPFLVIATQNPFGSVGTQMLPESQLDRFMVSIRLGYPDMKQELAMLQNMYQKQQAESVITAKELLEIQQLVHQVYISEEIYHYIGALVNRTRTHKEVDLGVSPRGTIALVKISQALAFVHQRDFVIPEDVILAAAPVMEHRIVINHTGKMNQITQKMVVEEILKEEKRPTLKRKKL